MKADEQKLNPYGNGCYRRRILLNCEAGKVLASLEDDCHGFTLSLLHNDVEVTGIDAKAMRIPLSTCPEAPVALKALIGIPLNMDPAQINREVDPRANCTHLYDLAVLAIAQAQRGGTRQYDVCVTDEKDGQLQLSVAIDDQNIHRWVARDWAVSEPKPLSGMPLMQGFAARANVAFEGDQREAAFVLQKGFFVSTARRFDLDALDEQITRDSPGRRGVCFSYSEPQFSVARRIKGSTRDFTDQPEQLLQFK